MTSDQLVILTYNVQCLGHDMEGLRKRREIADTIGKLKPKPDVVLFQEHRFVQADCISKTKQFNFLRGSHFWNETVYSASADSFKGGTTILLSSRVSDRIIDHGIITPGRAQFILLQWTKDTRIGIINVYGFNDTSSRARLWNQIRNFLLPEAQWIIAGDFNMIEQIEDKQGRNLTTGRGRREIESWHNLVISLGLHDSFLADEFCKATPKKYSWDNRRSTPDMVCTRIDKIYVSDSLREIGGLTGILPTIPHLCDHALVFLCFRFKKSIHFQKTPAFNRHLLEDKLVRDLLVAT